MKMLAGHAVWRGQPLSPIAEAAIAKRLDQIDRRIAWLERDVGMSVETLALFVRFWITTTPPLPEAAAKAARAQKGTRYDNVVAALGRRLNRLRHQNKSRFDLSFLQIDLRPSQCSRAAALAL
jgi:hypothetical protein